MSTNTKIREALAIVRGNQSAIEAIDAEDRQQREAVAREAKKRAEAEARHAKELPGRVQALGEHYVAFHGYVQPAVLEAAATPIAIEQLDYELGFVPLSVQSMRPAADRLSRSAVEAAENRLYEAAAVPWARVKRSANDYLAQTGREIRDAAAALANNPPPVNPAERKAELERVRQAQVAQRKRELGIIK